MSMPFSRKHLTFKNVDFAIYSAVSSYAFAYATIWADFQPHFTYTIYTTTVIDSANEGGPTASNVNLSPLGTVVFAQSDPHAPPLADANAGYSISWKPKNGHPVDLTFVKGQLVSQTDSDANGVCLQTGFVTRTLQRGHASSEKQACQVLIGLINGVHVVGTPLRLDSPNLDDNGQGEDSIPDTDAAVAKDCLADQIIAGVGIGIVSVLCLLLIIGLVKRCLETPDQEMPAGLRRIWTSYLQADYTRSMDSIGLSDIVAQAMLDADGIRSERLESTDVNGSNSEAPLGIVSQLEQSQIQQRDRLQQAELENRQLSLEEEEEVNQLSVRNNASINDEVNQTNIARQQLRNVDLRSDNAADRLANIQENINRVQDEIVNENNVLRLNSSKQNQLANMINQDQLRNQRIEADEEEEEKVDMNPNFVEEL